MAQTNFRASDMVRREEKPADDTSQSVQPTPEPLSTDTGTDTGTGTIDEQGDSTTVTTQAPPPPPAQREQSSNEVPNGTVTEVLDWVGENKGRARRAMEVEQGKDRPRSTLINELNDVLSR